MIEYWLTDSASINEWYCFPKQMHASFITLWQAIVSTFMWSALLKALAFSIICNTYIRNMTLCLFQECLIHVDYKMFPFWFINPLEYLLFNFLFVFCFDWLHIHSHPSRFLLAIYLLIFKASVLNFCKNFVFIFLSS